MQQSLSDLRLRLGAGYRLRIDSEPQRRKNPVLTLASWPCGCSAEGPTLRRLTLEPCREHRPAKSSARVRFAPLAALGLNRS
jgi:hypothetical protein